jgi:hypothetical protein
VTIPNPVGPHGSYHYVFTFQFEDQPGAQRLSSTSGLLTPGPRQTRGDLFESILRENIREDGAIPIPLFFALEPNELAAAHDVPN